MTRRLLAALVVASIPLMNEAATPAASGGTTCANLAALTMRAAERMAIAALKRRRTRFRWTVRAV